MEEEIQKQESIITAAGVDSRTKRRCVIMREQMNKKKEWWEEEGLGSESEEDNERDIGKYIDLITLSYKSLISKENLAKYVPCNCFKGISRSSLFIKKRS